VVEEEVLVSLEVQTGKATEATGWTQRLAAQMLLEVVVEEEARVMAHVQP